MAIKLTRAQAKTYGIRVSRAPRLRTARRPDGYASQLEADYAQVLRHDPAVRWWQYEAVRLTLAPKTTYTPDWLVCLGDGTVELHETKGFRREKDLIKLKVAAARFPCWRFVLVERVQGLWQTTLVPPY